MEIRRPSQEIGNVTIQVSKKFATVGQGHVISPARMQANMLQEAIQEHSAVQAGDKVPTAVNLRNSNWPESANYSQGTEKRKDEDRFETDDQGQRPTSHGTFANNVVLQDAQVFDQQRSRKGSEIRAPLDGATKQQTIWDAISKAGESMPVGRGDRTEQRQRESNLLSAQNSMSHNAYIRSPVSDFNKSWQEKAVSQAYRQYQTSQKYQQMNQDLLQAHNMVASPPMSAGKKAGQRPHVSPLQRIYGNGYLHRTGMVVHTSHQHTRKNKKRRMGSGGIYDVTKRFNDILINPNSVVLGSEKPFVPHKDNSSNTQSYKTQGPMQYQQSAIETVQHQGKSSFTKGKTLAEMLNLTTASTSAGPTRLNQREIAEAINRRDRYDNQQTDTALSGFQSTSNGGSPDNTKADIALSDNAATPHPLINIQTAQSQRETKDSFKTRFRKSEMSSKRSMNAHKKVMSLSAILDLDGSLVSSPKRSDGLSGATRLNSQAGLKSRKSLFNFAREARSLKQQVTMTKVREFLAGSGKFSENSKHFDLANAKPFREGGFPTKNTNQNPDGVASQNYLTKGGPSKELPINSEPYRTNNATKSALTSAQNRSNQINEQGQALDQHSFVLTPQITKSPPNLEEAQILKAETALNSQRQNTPGKKQMASIEAKNSGKKQGGMALQMRRLSSVSADGDSFSDVSSDWGPGFDDLNPAQKKILEDLNSATCRRELDAKRQEMRKRYKCSMKLINANMLTKWNTHINKSRQGGHEYKQQVGPGKDVDNALKRKHQILPNFEDRTQNLLKALFAVWSGKKSCISAENFHQKMTTFGLAPDLKFIEQVTNIVYQSRPKQQQLNSTMNVKNGNKLDSTIKRALSPDATARDSVSNASHIRFESSMRPGESLKSTKFGKSPSTRGAGNAPSAHNTIQSNEKAFDKNGEEICRHVNMQTFKSIYGHGLEVKFVKLLFLLLKKQMPKFIEHKNQHAKNSLAAQKRKQVSKRQSVQSQDDHGLDSLRPQRHKLIKHIEYARDKSYRRNQEHNFYRAALQCQMPQEIRSKMVHGFKVSQGMRSKHKVKLVNDDIERASSTKGKSQLGKAASSAVAKHSLRFSLKQYDDLINHMWRHQLDTEQKNEVSENKFVRFLRENKILTEKKQLDEMFKQCVYAKKGEELNVGSTIPLLLYQRLFMKPIMLLGLENALSLIEEHSAIDQAGPLMSMSPQGRAQSTMSGTTVVYPEMDATSLGQTLAVVGFHRKYMKQVFTSDELDMFMKFKAEAHRIKKLLKSQQLLDPKLAALQRDPLTQLEQYRAAKEGVEEAKPFGIDKQEAIKVMSFYGDKELEKSKMSKQQLKRLIEAQIMLEMAAQKRARANARSEARALGEPCDPTTSESEKEQEEEDKKKKK